jgi:Zn-dependent metalloprotease
MNDRRPTRDVALYNESSRDAFSVKTNFLFFLAVALVVFLCPFNSAQAADSGDNSSTQAVSYANESSLLQRESLVARVQSGKYSQVRIKPEVKVLSHDFFTRYAKDFDLSKDDMLKPVFSRANALHHAKSQIVIRYEQFYKGLPVIGMEYILQTDSANHVLAASGKIISGLRVDINPSVSESRALETAKHAVPAQIYSWEKDATKFPKGTLAISFKDFKIDLKNARLVYRFTTSSEKPSQSYVVEVDAHSGKVLNKIKNRIFDVVDWNQNIKGCQFVGDGITNPDRAVFPLCDKGVDGRYRLMCQADYSIAECASGLKMIDARRPNPQAHNGEDPDQDYVFTDEHQQTPPVFADVEDRVGGYLYLAMLFALKSYYSNFRWAGYDGEGEIPILACVRPTEDPYAGAYYDPNFNDDPHAISIVFDPVGAIEHDSNNNVNILYSALVAGHEFTHGVIRHMHPGFVYQGETASLDESFADIFGIFAAYYGSCYPAQDFKDCLKRLNHPARMENPWSRGLPTTYKGFYYAGSDGCNGSVTCYHTPEKTIACDDSNDNCAQEHRNATVQSYMFYLLATGGSGVNDPPLNHPYNVEGVGPSKAWRIAFQTMWTQLTATSTYPEARDGWIAAAEDLYGKNSDEVRAVTLAWYAVGIGDISDVSHKPADGDQNVPPWPVTLEWEDQPDEVEWDVQASTSPNFNSDLHTKQTSVATISPTSRSSSVNFDLKPDMNYYWRVRAKRNPSSSGKSGTGSKITTGPSQGGPGVQTDWGDWSLVRYFKTAARASTLKSPVGTGTKVYPWGDNEFKWTGVDGGKEYWLQTSEDKNLGIGSNLGPGQVTQGSTIQNVQPNNPLQSISLSGLYVDPNDPENREGANRIKHTLPFALKVNHTYYWGVLPYGPENIQGNWSNHQKGQIFETSNPPTKLISPQNFAKISPWGINLQWEETLGAVGYILKLSEHPDFSDNLYTGPDPTGTSVVISLPLDTEEGVGVSQGPQIGGSGGPAFVRRDYYWSVTPKGPPPWNEKGLASETWGFNIDRLATKPVLVRPPNGSHVPYKQALRFLWEPVDHATGYFFTLYNRNADGSRGAALLPNWSVPPQEDDHGYAYVDNAYLRDQGVTDKNGYCWQVQAIGPDDLQGNFNQGPPSDTFCYSLAPDKPILTNPVDGASGVEYNPTTFTWNSEWAPGGYQISVGFEGSSTGWVNVSGKSYTFNLKSNTNYSWVVDALGSAVERTSSGFSHFSTKCNVLPAPSPIYPPPNDWVPLDPSACGAGLCHVSLQWSAVPGATQYELTVELVPNSDSGDYTTKQSVVPPQYTNGTTWGPFSINMYKMYSWEVRAKNSCGWGPVFSAYFMAYTK